MTETAAGTAAPTGSDRPMPSSVLSTSQPTTIVWGELDRMFPLVYAERFRELLTSTDARLATVADAGHMVPYEQPDAVAAAVSAAIH